MLKTTFSFRKILNKNNKKGDYHKYIRHGVAFGPNHKPKSLRSSDFGLVRPDELAHVQQHVGPGEVGEHDLGRLGGHVGHEQLVGLVVGHLVVVAHPSSRRRVELRQRPLEIPNSRRVVSSAWCKIY